VYVLTNSFLFLTKIHLCDKLLLYAAFLYSGTLWRTTSAFLSLVLLLLLLLYCIISDCVYVGFSLFAVYMKRCVCVIVQPFYGGKRDQITAELYTPQDKKTSFCTVKGAWNGIMWARYAQSVSILWVCGSVVVLWWTINFTSLVLAACTHTEKHGVRFRSAIWI